jgi:hypothetical protein
MLTLQIKLCRGQLSCELLPMTTRVTMSVDFRLSLIRHNWLALLWLSQFTLSRRLDQWTLNSGFAKPEDQSILGARSLVQTEIR